MTGYPSGTTLTLAFGKTRIDSPSMVLPLFCCEEVASKWTSLTERWGEYLAICASHNAPVQKREEEDTGVVIHVEGLDTEQGGNGDDQGRAAHRGFRKRPGGRSGLL